MKNICKIFKKEKLLLIARPVQISILLTLLVFVFFVLKDDLIVRMDFTSYYTGASIIKSKMGNLLYDVSTQLAFQEKYFDTSLGAVPYKNLPLPAILFIPFSFFPLVTSYKLFVLVNIVLLIVSVKLLSKHFVGFDKRLSYVLVFLFFPTLIAVLLGQISLLILILWIYIFRTLKNKKAFLLGVLTALLLNKLQFLVFFPFVFILTKDKRKFLSGFFLTALGVLAISVAIVGWQGIISYPSFLRETESARYGSEIFSQIGISSAIHYFAYFFKIGFLKGTTVYLINFFIMLISLILFAKNYRKMSLEGSFSIATFLTLAFLPHGWEYALVILLVPVFCLLEAIHKEKDKRINKLPCAKEHRVFQPSAGQVCSLLRSRLPTLERSNCGQVIPVPESTGYSRSLNRIRILFIIFIFLLWTFRFWVAPFWIGISLAVIGIGLLLLKERLFFRVKNI